VAIENFIPELWAAAVLNPYLKALVYGQPSVVNTDYEGQIEQMGDTVHVTTIGYPTISSYDKTTDISIEDVDDSGEELTIDQGDYFAFRVNDIDKVQAAGNFESSALMLAGYGLRDTVDQFIASKFLTDTATSNQLGPVNVLDDDPRNIVAGSGDIAAWQVLVKLREALDSQSVPTDNRYAILPPPMVSALLMDRRFTSVAESGSSQALRQGLVGQAAGFDILESNNVPKVPAGQSGAGNWVVSAGVPGAISFATQLTEVEALREQLRFADMVRGLNIYGAKTFRPQGIATAYVNVVEPTTIGGS
jgi:hypothetical protein